MGCCGGKRAALRNQGTQPHRRRFSRHVHRRRQTLDRAGEPTAQLRREPSESGFLKAGAVTLRYIATAPILVVGPVTGRQYRFSRRASGAIGRSSRCSTSAVDGTLHAVTLQPGVTRRPSTPDFLPLTDPSAILDLSVSRESVTTVRELISRGGSMSPPSRSLASRFGRTRLIGPNLAAFLLVSASVTR